MTTPRQYRSKAAESAQLAKRSESVQDKEALIQAERSYKTLADNEEWLTANAKKLVPADPSRDK